MSRRMPERVRVWRKLVDAWEQSGQTINAFCRERKLTRSNFDRWRRILAAETSRPTRGAAPAFAWVYLGDAANPYTLFDLTPGRRQAYPEAFLAGYPGFVHADAYDGCNAVHGNARHLGCWMHARRYFVEVEPTDPRAVEAPAFIRTLYAVETELKHERARLRERFADEDAVRWRRTRDGTILARFAGWLGEQARSATPKSPFGRPSGMPETSGRP